MIINKRPRLESDSSPQTQQNTITRADRADMSEDDDRSPDPDPACTSGSSSEFGLSSVPSPYLTPNPDQVLQNVLENVLCFLTSRRDRNSASLVCHSWYGVEAATRSDLFIGNCYAVSPARATRRFTRFKSLTLKGKPRFSDFNLMPPRWGAHFEPWASAMSKDYSWLEKIHLKRMSVTNDDLGTLANSLSGFKELILVCCDGFGTSGLAAITSACMQLKVLDLIESEVADDRVDWISCFPEGERCLESLSFDCVEWLINFDALERLVARSPFLKKLRLNRSVSIGQLYRLMVRAPQITHLGTGSFAPSDDTAFVEQHEPDYASAFDACKSLVCLSGFREIVPDYLPAIYTVAANLTSLNFSYANISAEQLKPIIANCHKLQVFWGLDSICDEGLKAVAATCKDLRELRVFPLRAENEGAVSEVGLQAISEGCRKLQSILFFCQRMTNAAVIAMSNNCPDLLVFRLCIMEIRRADHVTGESMDEGFGAIVKNCKKLKRLAVSGLLTDQAFAYIGQHGKLVRTLSVAFAGESDKALKYVLKGCPKLQKLEIRDCPFGDEALRSGLHHYYNMRFLWMSSCRLSRAGCQEIANALPQLMVEVIKPEEEEDTVDNIGTLYMYRSLDGPRNDVPEFVSIL